METFEIKKKKVIVYAAGAIGGVIYHNLQRHNIETEAFIDKRAKSIHDVDGIKVFSPDELFMFQKKEEYVVIITPKNVFEHEDIAKKLYKIGFKYLVYKPKNVLFDEGNKEEVVVNSAYDFLVRGDIPFFKIPVLSLNEKHNDFKHWIIEKDDEYICTWIPAHQLFTNISSNTIWSGINITVHFPLVELYRSFLGDSTVDAGESIKNYIDYSAYGGKLVNIKITDDWKQNALETRELIFFEMSKLLKRDISFFTKNLPDVVLTKPNHFNMISSGKNRMAFLVANNFSYLPVKMCKKDFEQWLNYNKLEIQNKKKTNYPLFHPAYYDDFHKYHNYYQLWLTKIGIFLYKHVYLDFHVLNPENVQVLDASIDDNNAYEYLKSVGFNVIIDNEGNCIQDYYAGIFSDINLAITYQKYIKKYIFVLLKNQAYNPCMEGFTHTKILSTIWGSDFVEGYLFERT